MGLGCPQYLKHSTFTSVGAIDNLDPNLSSTASRDSFYDTGIS